MVGLFVSLLSLGVFSSNVMAQRGGGGSDAAPSTLMVSDNRGPIDGFVEGDEVIRSSIVRLDADVLRGIDRTRGNRFTMRLFDDVRLEGRIG